MGIIRTYNLKQIIRESGETHLSEERAAEFQAQCVDCGEWIWQGQDRCMCGSLVSWTGSKVYKRRVLVSSAEMDPAARDFLKRARTTRFRSGREYHRFTQATEALGTSKREETLANVEANLRKKGAFTSRAFIRYALNALELAATQSRPQSKSTLLEGDDVFRG
jgi:hypothetical protein